jgi:hypothetical protein
MGVLLDGRIHRATAVITTFKATADHSILFAT